ncbi:MAG: peptide ABC transporter substrate-binding protein [Chlamydiia bacterium]|nr:peptide ABC transporter substrate-binding protein [Chlamydiia bacterium]
MKKILLILFLIPVLFSCHKKKEKGYTDRFVNLAFDSSVRSLDPRISNDYPSVHLINMLYEGLMRLGPNGEILPGVAESVDISEDQCSYLFHLRDSKWSNGDPVTAYDFEYAWKKSVDPATAKNGAFTFYAIKNVEACLHKEVSIEEVGIRALDSKTFEVTLEHPAPYFLSLCTCGTYSPVHKQLSQDSFSQTGPFNGPFVLKSWRKNVELCIEKNPSYWDAGAVALPGIRIYIIQDNHTQLCMFEKNELDWMGQPFTPFPLDCLGDSQITSQIEYIDVYGLVWYFVNTQKPPFSNKNFRKAVAYALDRSAITEHILQFGEEPAMGILNQELSVQNKPYFEDGNIALAKEYFSKALEELALTEEDLSFVLSHFSGTTTSRIAQAVQGQLRQTLGLKVEVHQTDWPVLFNQLTKGDFEIGQVTWSSWLRDPIYMLDTFRSQNLATNMSRWEHPRYQELLSLSDHETNPVKRKEYLRQAEELLMEEMPVIPLCYVKLQYLRNPRLKGVYVSPLKEVDFRYAYFE